MDPYEILGISYPATREQIKSRYHELALKHHPDKLQHLPRDEIDRHEQELKKINIAYELLTKSEYQHKTKNEWSGIWANADIAGMFNDPDLLRDANDILKNIINQVKNYTAKMLTEHYINLEVSIEDIYNKKDKKLRLFLKGFVEPIFINVNCKDYPFLIYKYKVTDTHTVDIHITFKVIAHPVYSLDHLFETKDIFYNLDISLYDYLYGCTKTLFYLDNTTLEICVNPCEIQSIEIPHKGLYNEGKLIVFVKVILPEKSQMDAFNDERSGSKLKKYLKGLCSTPHSGILENKSI